MAVYIILLLIALFLLLFRNTDIFSYVSKFILIVCFVVLFSICVFRAYSVGTDYHIYHMMFLSYNYEEMISNSIELGFAHLMTLAQTYNNFLIIPSFVFIIGWLSICLIGERFKINKFTLISFFILTGLYFQMFSALRQMIAISIVYIGIYIWFKFDHYTIIGIVSFVFCIWIAQYFHRSAIFALIFLILPKIHYGKKTVVISGISTILIFLLGNKFINTLMSKIPFYGSKYSGSTMANINSFGNTIQLIPIIIQFIFLYLYLANNDVKNTRTNRFILSGYLLYLCLFSCLGNNAFRRLQIYTFIFPMLFSCFFIDESYLKGKLQYKLDKYNKIEYIIFWCILYILKLISNKTSLLPYSML